MKPAIIQITAGLVGLATAIYPETNFVDHMHIIMLTLLVIK